ncbi:MAG: hypothetical protein NTZ63_00475 [Candidatus Omnitrophica bacterium]|nr:hypothetical protein [Candidatus Omnitrophota bacterium]
MKWKLYLKNLAKPSLLLFSLLSLILLSGCSCPTESTYKEKEIPDIIKKICREEYNLSVTTQRVKNTLWIYAPLDKLIHKEFDGINQDKIFDEGMLDKAMHINITIGRVLMSSDNTPEFFVLIFSDIKVGIDYILIGNILDMKKAYSGFLPEDEIRRRYVIRFKSAPEAIGDTTGFHFIPYNITIQEFLSDQIAQRIGAQFQDEEMKKYFKVEKSDGKFVDGVFYFGYSITETSKPKKKTNVRREILKTIAYCLKSYDFQNFTGVTLTDLEKQERTDYNKAEVIQWANQL